MVEYLIINLAIFYDGLAQSIVEGADIIIPPNASFFSSFLLIMMGIGKRVTNHTKMEKDNC